MNPKCEASGCAKQPYFSFPGERRRRCKAHMLEGMVRVMAQGVHAVSAVLTRTVLVSGGCSELQVRGQWLRKAALFQLSGRAAAAVQGAHAGGHGARVGSEHACGECCADPHWSCVRWM